MYDLDEINLKEFLKKETISEEQQILNNATKELIEILKEFNKYATENNIDKKEVNDYLNDDEIIKKYIQNQHLIANQINIDRKNSTGIYKKTYTLTTQVQNLKKATSHKEYLKQNLILKHSSSAIKKEYNFEIESSIIDGFYERIMR